MPTEKNPTDDSLRLELQEALVTFRNWIAQATQAFGVLVTGDALLITYGFSQRSAAILFFASGLPIGMVILYLQIMSTTAPLVTLAARIERKLSIKESLAATYAKSHFRPLGPEMADISKLSDEDLLKVDQRFSARHWLRKRIPILLYLTTVIQLGLAVLGLTVYNYKFM